jgi:hypothetical protein
LTVYPDADATLLENVKELGAGEPAALVGVADLRRPVARKGLFRCFAAELGVR